VIAIDENNPRPRKLTSCNQENHPNEHIDLEAEFS
jgi:hypothetical protein